VYATEEVTPRHTVGLLCFHPKIATPPELDQFGALIFYHEAIHLLSSSGDLVRTLKHTEQHAGSAWSTFHEPFYRYYVAEASPQHLFLPYLRGTRTIDAKSPDLIVV
jgi:hypothetical protein